MFNKRKMTVVTSCLLLIVAIFSLFSSKTMGAQETTADAQNFNNEFITKTDIQNKTGGSPTIFNVFDTIYPSWILDIQNGQVKGGDTLTIDIPQIFKLNSATVDITVTDTSGVPFAHGTAFKDQRKIQLTVDQSVKPDHGLIEAIVRIPAQFNTDVVPLTQDTVIKQSQFGSQDVTVTRAQLPDLDEKIFKFAWYDDNNPKIIHWRVRLNYAKLAIKNATYKDQLGLNQKLLPDTISAYKFNYHSDGSNFDVVSMYHPALQTSDSSFEANFGDLNDNCMIDYETEITDNLTSIHYHNTGYLSGDNLDVQQRDADSPDLKINDDATSDVDIKGSAQWNDQDNVSGSRPSIIKVNLLADGVFYAQKETNQNNNWIYSFDNVPKYQSNGQNINYTISEEQVPDYTTSINGYNITNSYYPEKSITVHKIWNDQNNVDQKRPASVTVNLFANGSKIKNQTLSSVDNWQFTFNNLASYQNDKPIDYTVSEDEVQNYSTQINGFDITNTYVPKTSVTVHKTWNDQNNIDQKRPASVTVHLFANGSKVQDSTLTANNNWQATFDSLDKYRDSNLINYTVSEDAVQNYSTQVNGFDITNTYVPKTSVTVHKTWNDQNNVDQKRPASVTVHLFANGSKVQDSTLTANNNWQVTFDSLDKYQDSKLINYTVSEDAVHNYSTQINGFDITNTYVPKTSVTVHKTWNDQNNVDQKRPASVTVHLFANGSKVQDSTLTANNNWQVTFDSLDKYQDSKLINYTVSEDAVHNYSTQINGFDITNTYVPKTSVTVHKTWNDQNNVDQKRPASVTVHLFANGSKVQDSTLTANNNWQVTFDSLDKYQDSKLINYTVSEDAVHNYSTQINGFDITNTYVPKTSVTVHKTWNDQNNVDQKRPASVTVHLFANGSKVQDSTLTANNNWQVTFDSLDKYQDSKLINYTVSEDAVHNYSTQINGFDITNTYVPKTSVTVHKTWNDQNNVDQKRPASVTVHLFANGSKVQDSTLTANNNWQVTFDSLDKYQDSKLINYTVSEDAVHNYSTQINGFEIINTHKHIDSNNGSDNNPVIPNNTETTKIEGQKTWIDNDNEAQKRPNSIFVTLLSNGNPILSKLVKSSDNWHYVFDNLPKYQNNKLITYSITEDKVDNYSTKINGFNIINTIYFENNNQNSHSTDNTTNNNSSSTDHFNQNNSNQEHNYTHGNNQNQHQSSNSSNKNNNTMSLPQTGQNSFQSILLTTLGTLIVIAVISLTVITKYKH